MASKRRKPITRAKKGNKSGLMSAFLAGALIVGLIWFTTGWISHHEQLPFGLKKAQLNFSALQSSNQTLPNPNVTAAATATSPTPAPTNITVTAPTPQPSSPLPNPAKTMHYYLVYLANYSDFHQADNQRAYLILNGYDAKVTKTTTGAVPSYILWIGPFPSLEAAYHIQAQLKTQYADSHINMS